MKSGAQMVTRVTARLWARLSAQFILLMAFVGLLYFLAYFTLNSTVAFRAFDEAANGLFRGEIGWGRIAWGPIPWELRVLDPVLIGADGRPVASARELHLNNVDLTALLDNRLHVEGARLVEPSFHLRERAHPESFDDMGNPVPVLNITEMFWAPVQPVDDGSPASPFAIDIGGIEIEGASYDMILGDVRLSIEGLDISGGEFRVDTTDPDSMRIGAHKITAPTGLFALGEGEGAVEVPLSGLRLGRYTWRSNRFTVSSVVLKSLGDDIELRQLAMDLNRPNLPSLGVHFDIKIHDLGRRLRPFGVDMISGAVRLSGQTSGELDSAQVQFAVEGPRLKILDYTLEDWRIEGSKSPTDEVTLSQLAAKTLGGSIELALDADLKGTGRAGGHLFFEAIDPESLIESLDPQLKRLLAGQGHGVLFFDGHDLFTDQPAGGVALNLGVRRTAGRVMGVGADVRLKTVARWTAPDLELREFELESGRYDVTAAGALNAETEAIGLTGTVKVSEMGDVMTSLGVPLTGSARASYRVAGTLSNPCVTTRGPLRLRRLEFSPWPVADLTGQIAFCDGVLKVDGTEILTEVGKVNLDGTLDLGRESMPINMSYQVRRLQLDKLPLGVDVGGKLRVRGRVTGPIQRPAIQARGRVRKPRFEAFGAGRITFDGRFKNDRVDVNAFALHRGGRELLTASGNVDLRRKRYGGKVHLDRANLLMINEFVKPPLPIKGSVSLRFDGEGRFSNPAGSGHLEVHQLSYDTLSLGDAALDLSTADGWARVEGTLFKVFKLDAKAPTDPSSSAPASAQLSFDAFKVETLLPQLAQVGARAQLTGAVTTEVDLSTGKVIKAGARLTELTARQGDIELRNEGDVVLSQGAQMGEINVDQLSLGWFTKDTAKNGLLTVSGGASPDQLDLALAGWVEFAAVQPFLADVFTHMDGRVSLDLKLNGPPAAVRPSGQVVIEPSLFVPRSSTVASDARILRPVRFDILSQMGPVDPNAPGGVFSIQMPRFARRDGRLVSNAFLIRRDGADLEITEVSGNFINFAPVLLDVEVEGEELSLRIPRVLRGAVDLSPLHFRMWQVQQGRREETFMKVSGEVRLLRGEFIQDIQAEGLGAGLGRNFTGTAKASSLSAFERVPLLKKLALDLRVVAQNDFFVRNTVSLVKLDLELETDVRVTGFLYENPNYPEDEQLRLNGYAATLTDSKVTYSGRPFELHLGRVDFGSGDANVVDGGGDFMTGQFEASHTFRIRVDEGDSSRFDADIRLEEVTLSGEARMPTRNSALKLEPRLSSSSGLSNFEIATLMLTGQLPSKVTGAATAQSASGALFGGIIDLIGKPFEETLKLDQLNLTPDAAGALYIDAEKVLSRRLRLYAHAPISSEDQEQSFGVESQLNNLFVAELTNEQVANLSSTSFRLRLHLDWD